MSIFMNTTVPTKLPEYDAFIKNGGQPILSQKVKYIGGHPVITREQQGELAVNSKGVWFSGKNRSCFLIPIEKIISTELKTGEDVAQNPVFSRLLAIGGFAFAFKKKTIFKHMFLIIRYFESGIENAALFETKNSSEFASAIARIRQELNELKAADPEAQKTISELFIQINELHALGILTDDEFIAKKRELLLRI